MTLHLFDDRQDVFLAHQQQFLVADLELLAGVAGEQHAVADLDLQRLRVPSSNSLPSPTLMTVPREGLSLAVSGSTMPPAVLDSDSSRSTTTRSPSGCKRTLLVLFGFGLVAVALMLMLSPRLLGRYSK